MWLMERLKAIIVCASVMEHVLQNRENSDELVGQAGLPVLDSIATLTSLHTWWRIPYDCSILPKATALARIVSWSPLSLGRSKG